MNILTAGFGIIKMMACELGMLATQVDYDLTVIRDEPVPLAPSVPAAGDPAYFLWTMVMMFLMVVVAAAGIYIFRCAKYRKCYYGMLLSSGENGKMKDPGWNLMKIKQLVNETENQLVERMV